MGNAGNCLEGYLPMEAHSDLSALDDNGELLWSVVWICLLGIVAFSDVYFSLHLQYISCMSEYFR